MTDALGAAIATPTLGSSTTTLLLHAACSAVHLCLALLILLQAGRVRRVSRTGTLLAAACLATAGWSAAAAAQGSSPLASPAAALDIARALIWYGFILHLYRRAVAGRTTQERGGVAARFGTFGWLGMAGLAAAIATLATGQADAQGWVALTSPGIALRLGVAVCQLLLLENLYRNTPADLRWHVNLICIALGGLAAFDMAACADAALFHRVSPTLVDARPLAAILVAPLLALAAARNRQWDVDIHLSRAVAFHSATLVLSGVFLLALAAAGEVARRMADQVGGDWGGVARISLLFAGLMTLAVLLTSASARSALRAALVDHFFTSRYDYRREWLRCIDTLSGPDGYTALHQRVIRAVAQVVDSPGGMLLLREPREIGLHWAGSWNMPALGAALPGEHPLARLLHAGDVPVELAPDLAPDLAPGLAPELPQIWLAVPLRDRGELAGCVLVARPRVPFRLDREVFDLLRILAREVATYLAEQRATRVLLETRELRAYGEQFAFVAHDIKNVSSQLSLLLSNAETHLANPEFQRDMLATVGASVRKITALIRRLKDSEHPDADPANASSGRIDPAARLRAIAERTRQVHDVAITLDTDGRVADVAIEGGAFDAVVTHVLDNAIEAAGAERPIAIRLRNDGPRVLVDITDQGHGMSPEFIRDELFRPLRTSKRGGSGIGAFQSRVLLREAGGDLQVSSSPGSGTTMRLLLPAAAAPAGPATAPRA